MNGIGLEKYTKIIGKGMHGNHPAYDKYVKTQLDRFNKIGLTPEQANKFLQEELIPDLKKRIIEAKNSGMNLNEYFKIFQQMKYFIIEESIDLDIIGKYPQVSPTENCVLGSPFSNKRLSFGEIPNKIPYLELEFNKKAKKQLLILETYTL